MSESNYRFVQVLKARDGAASDDEILHKYLIVAIDPTEAEIITELIDMASEPDEPIDEETERMIKTGFEDVRYGRYRSLRDIAKDLGI